MKDMNAKNANPSRSTPGCPGLAPFPRLSVSSFLRPCVSSFLCLAALLLAVVFLILPATGCKKAPAGVAGQKYHCPMHPTYIRDQPGDCGICGMKLVPIKADSAAPAPAAKSAHYHPNLGQYFCLMKCPGSISDHPGNCPVCGMKLVLMDEERMKTLEKEEAAAAPAPMPDRATVLISSEKRQTIGLRTSLVEPRDLAATVHATAVVEHDETGFTRIAPRFNGWVKKLKVNYTGQIVNEGEVLFSAYSPDLLAGQNEFLLALRNYHQSVTNQAMASQLEGARRLMESARKRLLFWQLGEEEIKALEERQEVLEEIVFRSPITGHVTMKTAVEGRAFTAGESLYEIADLHHLWLRVAVFERDFPRVKVGQKAHIRFPQLPGTNFETQVTFIYPHMDPLTRRGEVRLELDNPGHLLRPDMWANVDIEMPLGRPLAAPASAFIDTGLRFVAFVDRADGHLEPRDVQIGAQTDDYFEILGGLKEGEKVVTRALFLVDSESQLKAAISGMK
jgi:RND family efflux transporter MFP subunit